MPDDDLEERWGAAKAAKKATRKKGAKVAYLTPDRDFDLARMNAEFALVRLGGKVAVMWEAPDAGPLDPPPLLTIEAFREWFANRVTFIDGVPFSWADIWRAHDQRRQYRGMEFAPGTVGEDIGREGYYNLWKGFTVEPEPGDIPQFTDHLLKNVCYGNEDLYRWLFGWFAHIFQHPRERIGTAIVLRGGMGAGKTKIGEVFGALLGQHYLLIDDPRYLVGNFNAHMASLLLLQADEAFWAGDKRAEGRLKGLVTSGVHMVEHKGFDAQPMPNFLRLLITTNEDWAVPAGPDERRFAVFDVSSERAQDHAYFAAIDAEMENGGRAHLLWHLLNFDLSTVNLRKIPQTAGLLDQKIESLKPEDQWWFDRLYEGSQIRDGGRADDPGWRDLVRAKSLYDDYVRHADAVGVRRKATETKLGKALRRWMPTAPDCVGIGRAQRYVRVGWSDRGEAIEKKRWVYLFPPLEEARRSFAAYLKQSIDWPDIEASAPANGAEIEDDP